MGGEGETDFSRIELALLYYHGMPSTAYFLVSTDSSPSTVIPSVISQWEKEWLHRTLQCASDSICGTGGAEGADHTLLPMTGGDRWSRPKSHSFGSTQSYFPVIPVGAEAIGITIRPCPPPVPPLFPPHNHRWGFTRTGRSRPNRCAQGENVALFVYPPRSGRTDRFDAQTVSGPIIRTIARPHPLPVIGGIERGRGGSGPNPCAQREKVSLFPYPPALVVPVSPMRARNKVSLAPWSC